MCEWTRAIIGLIFFFVLTPTSFAEDSILWQQIKIPMMEAGSKGLEGVLVWPNTPGKHPLVLISFGSSRDPDQRKEQSSLRGLPMAMEFARRGYTVAIIIRRGYGHSGGGWAEEYGQCNDTHYLEAGLTSSTDLHAAIKYLATLPQVNVNKIIAVGVSAGGFASLALSADSPPPGLQAVINFAGGRGSTASNFVCQPEALISAFGTFGKTSRVPTLWVYAQNDHYLVQP